MLRRLVLLTGALALSVSALAADVGGVKLVDKASVGGQDLVLNGAGIRTRAFFKVYVAGLYVPAKSADPAAILAKGRAASSSTCCATCPASSSSVR